MNNIALQAEDIGKLYRLGENSAYNTIRDAFSAAASGTLRRILSREQKHAPVNEEGLWALKDVSFDVKVGDIVGLIGRNGAGKSTLLKILSRITEPTRGRAEIRGRVGSLLEVGTGFHPELTGRENIFLSGAILGMRRSEINRRFDEIVAFSEIEKFLDTPAKRYSSGMFMRLAFSVAAHLEPEILLVDEVLAVGDAAFQRKCLGKMTDVARQGRTILFVSHNMAAVMNLCTRGILIQDGQVAYDGAANVAVDKYLGSLEEAASVPLAERKDRKGNQALQFLSFELQNEHGDAIEHARSGEAATLALRYRSKSGLPLSNVHVGIGVHGKHDDRLFHLTTSAVGSDFASLPPEGVIRCELPRLPLQPGRYPFNLYSTAGGDVADWIQPAGFLIVETGDFFRSGKLPPAHYGAFLVDHSWCTAS